MSGVLTGRRRTPSHAGAAFLMESIVLMGFLVVSLAVFATLFSQAQRMAHESTSQGRAVAAARVVAERFAADPQNVEEAAEQDGLTVTYAVENEVAGDGTLYHAQIKVLDASGEELYGLTTSCFVGGAR